MVLNYNLQFTYKITDSTYKSSYILYIIVFFIIKIILLKNHKLNFCGDPHIHILVGVFIVYIVFYWIHEIALV